MMVCGLHMGSQQEGSGATGARRFTNTSPSGLGNIHPEGQVGQDLYWEMQPLHKTMKTVMAEELREPEASTEEMHSGTFFSSELHICSTEHHDGCHVCCLYW